MMRTAYFWITIIGLLPAVAAYTNAKYFFHYKKRSAGQVAMLGFGLAIVFGTILSQGEILKSFGVPPQNNYLKVLTIAQFLLAIIVFFWKITGVNKRRIKNESL